MIVELENIVSVQVNMIVTVTISPAKFIIHITHYLESVKFPSVHSTPYNFKNTISECKSSIT